jgi:ribose transport system substrate-binding protein
MLKGRKVSLVLCVVLVFALILSACGGGASNSGTSSTASKESKQESTSGSSSDTSASAEGKKEAASEAEKYRIGVVLMALNSDYWHMVEAGALIAAKELGAEVTVVGPNAESDVTGQIAMVEDMLAKKVDAIVLSRNDPQALIPVCQKAKDAGIPVITIDGDIADPKMRDCFIGTENVDAAKEAGKFIASKLQAGDKAAIIRGLPGAPTHDQREKGCKDYLESEGIKIASVQPADSERAKAVGVAENILQANPDVKAIYATNDEMALGAYQAVSSMGKEVVIVGFDGSPDAVKSIIEGKLTASVAQMPILQGYTGVETALKLLKGETVEDHIKLPVEVVTKENAEEFQKKIQADMEKAKQ